MILKDKILSKTLKIQNGKLLRNVEDIDSVKKLIEILSKKGYISSYVINTKIYSEEEKLVEHDILKYIIHSGEYTESMAYDVNKLSLEMAIDLAKENVFAYDLLPHNFTFYNGKWFLYDFDSFQFNPKKSITQLRGFFKIIFSNFEILRLISREKIEHYYLTRYRIEDILHIIPFHRWLYLYFNQTICNVLYSLGFYKLTYSFMKNLYDKYTKNFEKKYYEYKKNDSLSFLNEILKENEIKSAFCVGEESAKWAISNENSNVEIQKLVYFNDYNLCDAYYNYIVKNDFKNIIPAVLYPLVEDENIPYNYEYRALYDSYAKERFYSDCVIALNISENVKSDFLKNLSSFTSNMLILSSNKFDKDDLEYLKNIYNDVYIKNGFIIAKNKIKKIIPVANSPYKDGNRGPFAHKQSAMVKELIQKNK